MQIKKSILAASVCCLLFLLASPITADRAGTPLNLVKRPKKEKKVKPSSNIHPSNMYGDNNGYGQTESKFRMRPKNGSRGSLLLRSFLLAALFWTVRFMLPHAIRYLRNWNKDGSYNNTAYLSRRGYGRKKAKPRYNDYDDDVSTVGPADEQTISPSVMSLLEMGNDAGDDASVSTSMSSFSSYFDSFRSYASRRRSRASSAPKSHHHHQSNGHHDNSKHYSSSPSKSKSKPTKSSKQHHHEDKNLYYTEEDYGNNGNNIINGNHSSSRNRKKGNRDQNFYNLDDASNIPSAGSSLQKDHGYNANNSDPSSPLERKLASALGPSPEDTDHINYHKRGKEKHHHRKNSNQGRHRHRDRTR